VKVALLHQHYWPEIAATAQLVTDLCEDLCADGHSVSVYCGQPSYRETVRRTLPRQERHRGVEIHRVWSYRPEHRTIAGRLAQYSSYFAASLGAIAAHHDPPDVVLVVSTPPLLLGVSGALLRAVRGVPFVYSVQDLYPDVAMDLGVLRPGLLANSIDQVALGLYRAATRLVAVSESMAVRLVKKGVPPDRIDVIHNWADTDAVTPLPRDNPFARAHGLADGFVVQYAGNVGRSQGLEQLPAAAAALRELPITFVVVGDGDARAALEREVARTHLTNVRFLPPQPRESLAELLASSDVGFVPMRRGIGGDLMPSKLYGIMAAARPVLAAVEDESEVATVVRQSECGFVVPAEDPAALAEVVRQAWTARAELPAIGARGREACARLFGRRAATRRYADVLARAVESRRPGRA
jgi:colanic acid biosynthesis glycosyl transferase WcaI